MFAELKKIYDFLSQRNMMQSKQKFKRKCTQYQRRTKTNDSFLSEIGHLLMPCNCNFNLLFQYFLEGTS